VTAPPSSASVALRPWAPGDLWLLRRLLGEPEMMRFLGGPESPEAIEARHQRYLTSDPATNGLFTIVADPGPAPVGWVGFWESEWDGEQVWECGWNVLPEAQGRGVATSAAALMLAEARRRCLHRSVHALPSVDNAASNALCRALGFACRREVEVEYPKGHLMRSNDWRLELWPAWDPRTTTTGGGWTEEAREEALARAPGFGRRFFTVLAARFPQTSGAGVFLRWSLQPGDVYAVVDLPDCGFALQVDPDLEYLIVWTASARAEFGDWDGDQVDPALAFIAEILAASR
jgi:RimJ/RimL family protein N-acetyltransferase